MTHVQISISKAKVGPVTQRYVDGEYRDVDGYHSVGDDDDTKRVAICGLDNSHNGDYKVAYASDPLLTVTSDGTLSHDELRSVLERYDMDFVQWNPIEIPYTDKEGNATWKAGFKSLPRSANWLDRFKDQIYQAVEREIDYVDSENTVHGYVPVE